MRIYLVALLMACVAIGLLLWVIVVDSPGQVGDGARGLERLLSDTMRPILDVTTALSTLVTPHT